MIPILIFLLAIIALGVVLYVYLRQEQNKVIPPKDKYDEAWNEFYNSNQFRPKLSASISDRSYHFLKPFLIALLATGVVTALKVFLIFGIRYFLLFILVEIFFIPLFPIGLTALGYLIYPAILFFGISTKNRKVFSYIYIAFIILLILNIFGCAAAIEPNMLSNIN